MTLTSIFVAPLECIGWLNETPASQVKFSPSFYLRNSRLGRSRQFAPQWLTDKVPIPFSNRRRRRRCVRKGTDGRLLTLREKCLQ